MLDNRVYEILDYMPVHVKCMFKNVFDISCCTVEEIRIRIGKPIVACIMGENYAVLPDGTLSPKLTAGYLASSADVKSIFQAMCENSVYAYLEEIRQGFLTIKGGHRVGFSGRVVTDGADITNFREISSLNIRIAHEIIGAADPIMPQIMPDGRVRSTLVIAPPLAGKTTLLRDITRQISNRGVKVALVDERGELAAMYQGEAQNDVGVQTDVMENAPKRLAIIMMLRAMAPQVIVTDEVATAEEVSALLSAAGTGVSILASTHGSSLDEVRRRGVLAPLFSANIFEQVIVLQSISIGTKQTVTADVIQVS